MSETWHVEPVDDIKPHTDENCKCQPRIEDQPNGNILVIHNSYDGREFFEKYAEPHLGH